MRSEFPEVEALLEIFGIGLYAALLVIGELDEVHRFRTARQVSSNAGLTSRVRQSGDHCHRGAITREGSPWLRWILVEASMKPCVRSTTEKLLSADPQALRGEQSACRCGAQVGGDLLEATNRLARPNCSFSGIETKSMRTRSTRATC